MQKWNLAVNETLQFIQSIYPKYRTSDTYREWHQMLSQLVEFTRKTCLQRSQDVALDTAKLIDSIYTSIETRMLPGFFQTFERLAIDCKQKKTFQRFRLSIESEMKIALIKKISQDIKQSSAHVIETTTQQDFNCFVKKQRAAFEQKLCTVFRSGIHTTSIESGLYNLIINYSPDKRPSIKADIPFMTPTPSPRSTLSEPATDLMPLYQQQREKPQLIRSKSLHANFKQELSSVLSKSNLLKAKSFTSRHRPT